MARHPALASRLARFFARPLVRRSFLMRRLPALAGDLALLAPIHRRKSPILFGHFPLRAHPSATPLSGCNRCATISCKLKLRKELATSTSGLSRTRLRGRETYAEKMHPDYEEGVVEAAPIAHATRA